MVQVVVYLWLDEQNMIPLIQVMYKGELTVITLWKSDHKISFFKKTNRIWSRATKRYDKERRKEFKEGELWFIIF